MSRVCMRSCLSPELLICDLSIVYNWTSHGVLFSERETFVRKTSCHDVVDYQLQRERLRKLPRSIVPVPIREYTYELRK